jgi:hypothetical protein
MARWSNYDPCMTNPTTKILLDGWPDDVRLSDIEPKFTRTKCGQRGAEVRPNFRVRGWGPVSQGVDA